MFWYKIVVIILTYQLNFNFRVCGSMTHVSLWLRYNATHLLKPIAIIHIRTVITISRDNHVMLDCATTVKIQMMLLHVVLNI